MTTWVPVLVRLEDYEEITRLIADREAGREDQMEFAGPSAVLTSNVASSTVAGDPDDEQLASWTPWSHDDLRKLAEGTSATARRWTLAMDACCEVADTEQHWLSTSEVAERTGMTVNQWRDAPRKLTRHLKANYPSVPLDEEGHHVWPLLAKWKPGSGEVHWAMNTEQAARWRKVRGMA